MFLIFIILVEANFLVLGQFSTRLHYSMPSEAVGEARLIRKGKSVNDF